MKKLLSKLGLAFLTLSFIGCYEECPPGPCSSSCINSYKSGAVCNDGSTTSSTGQGTCSGHGGVDYWTYSCD